MEDRVAEVLAERSALASDTWLAVVASILLHAGFGGLGVYAALRQAPLKTASMVNIQFAAAQREVRPAAAPPKRVEPKTITEPLPAPVTPVEPKPVAREEKAVPKSAFGRSAKKGSDAPPPPPPAPATTAPAVDVPIGGAAVTGLEGGDFPYTIYIERMKSLIGSRWLRPKVNDGTTATVHFVIERDGRIRDARLDSSSGLGIYDRAALRAVIETSPLPPLPFAYNGTYLGVRLTFK